jgi:hypothetical protein
MLPCDFCRTARWANAVGIPTGATPGLQSIFCKSREWVAGLIRIVATRVRPLFERPRPGRTPSAERGSAPLAMLAVCKTEHAEAPPRPGGGLVRIFRFG